MPLKIAITGAPSSGKTTVVKKLAEIGYTTVEEAATIVIKEGKYHPTSNPIEFQRAVLQLQIQLETEALSRADGLIFCDRGIYDGIAYLESYEITDHDIPFPERWDYYCVFHFAPLPYVTDGVRFESEDEAIKLSELLQKTYCRLGYRLIGVPAMSVEDRVEFLLSRISAG